MSTSRHARNEKPWSWKVLVSEAQRYYSTWLLQPHGLQHVTLLLHRRGQGSGVYRTDPLFTMSFRSRTPKHMIQEAGWTIPSPSLSRDHGFGHAIVGVDAPVSEHSVASVAARHHCLTIPAVCHLRTTWFVTHKLRTGSVKVEWNHRLSFGYGGGLSAFGDRGELPSASEHMVSMERRI